MRAGRIIKITAAVAIMALLSNCGGVPLGMPDLDSGYQLSAAITADGLDYKANINRVGNNVWDLTFVEPYSVQGGTWTFDGKSSVYTFDGVEAGGGEYSAFNRIASAMESAVAGEGVKLSREKENLLISGMNSGGRFVMTLDRASNLPVALSLPDDRIEVTFSSAKATELSAKASFGKTVDIVDVTEIT